MKITRILSASVLAGAVLLSGTACSVLDMGKKTETTATETSAVPSDYETVAPIVEGQAVADAVNGYYNYVLMEGSLDEIKQAGERFNGRDSVTDEELNELVISLPHGFQYFDTSSPDLIKTAYLQLLTGASTGEVLKGVDLMIPHEAVTVDGDTATVNSAMAVITKDGEVVDSETNPDTKPINLKKNDSGSWVIIAEVPAS